MAEAGDHPERTLPGAGADHAVDLLIGLGNMLRGDDGVGPYLAERAAGQWPQLRVRGVHQMTPELSSDLAEARRVLFIDAWSGFAGALPLQQRRGASLDTPHASAGANGCSGPWLLPLEPIATDAGAAAEAGAFSHRLDPLQLLAITALLHGRTPQAWQLLVPAFRCDHGEGLSPELQALLPRAETLLHSWCDGCVADGRGDRAHA